MATQIEHLVKMAEQIALNFRAWGDEDAVAEKICEHLRKFWTPAMQGQLLDNWRADATVLSPAVQHAMARLEEETEKG